MKQRTKKEVRDALSKLPKPLLGFIDSGKLSDLYSGIQKKHKLTFAEIVSVADATNASLLGLEPESALETNLHQLMPELSNAVTRELVADINDRIFKEAHRRVEENIIEQHPMTLNAEIVLSEEEKKREAELEKIEELPDDSPELEALREAEHKEFEEKKKREHEEDERLVAQEPKETEETPEDPDEEVRKMFEWVEKNPGVPLEEAPFAKKRRPTPEEELAAEEKAREEKKIASAPSVKIGQSEALKTAEEGLKSSPGAAVVDGMRTASIAQVKLGAPTTATPTETASVAPLTETPSQIPKMTAPPAPKRVDGIDPYREPFE